MRKLLLYVVVSLLLITQLGWAVSAVSPLETTGDPFSIEAYYRSGELRVEFRVVDITPKDTVQVILSTPGEKTVLKQADLTSKNPTIILEKVTLEEQIEFFVRYNNRANTPSYSGRFLVREEKASANKATLTVSMTIDYRNDTESTDYMQSSIMYETEPNNTYTQANTIYDNIEVRGTLNIGTDRDWFKISFPQSGNANFFLCNIPAGCDYDLYLYDSNGTTLLAWSEKGSNADELITYRVGANKTYYVLIAPYQGCSSPLEYSFRAKNYPYIWFSQSWHEDGTQQWNRTNLTNVYFPNMQSCKDFCGNNLKCSHTPLFTISSYVPAANQLDKGHINKWGCVVTSWAMVLNNMGAKTTSLRRDLRTGVTSYLDADPFTVTMANIGWLSDTHQSGRWEIRGYTDSFSPVYARHGTIASSFGKTAKTVDLAGLSHEEKARHIAYYLGQNPEGILASYGTAHTIVIAETTYSLPGSWVPSRTPSILYSLMETEGEVVEPDIRSSNLGVMGTEYDSHFICYDPAATSASLGKGRPLNGIWSYGVYGGLDNITRIRFAD